jgi:hypothetical protein
MNWTRVMRSLRSDHDDDAAVPSRRDVLAGIGVAGLFAVAGSTLLASPAQAEAATPAPAPEPAPADAAKGEANDRAASDSDEMTEFSAQYWYGPRRRYWRRRRRWRRRYWRRRYYWGYRRPYYWRRRYYWRRPYWRRRYWW